MSDLKLPLICKMPEASVILFGETDEGKKKKKNYCWPTEFNANPQMTSIPRSRPYLFIVEIICVGEREALPCGMLISVWPYCI